MRISTLMGLLILAGTALPAAEPPRPNHLKTSPDRRTQVQTDLIAREIGKAIQKSELLPPPKE